MVLCLGRVVIAVKLALEIAMEVSIAVWCVCDMFGWNRLDEPRVFREDVWVLVELEIVVLVEGSGCKMVVNDSSER